MQIMETSCCQGGLWKAGTAKEGIETSCRQGNVVVAKGDYAKGD